MNLSSTTFKDQRVLVTGGSGMIGRSLVKVLLERGAVVTIADLTVPTDLLDRVTHISADLRYFDQCESICTNMTYVFNLVGIKGSPKMCAEQPADFMVPMLQFNTNMMEAARRAKVNWYLYTSSIGVYSPAEVFKEDDTLNTSPSPKDRFAGWVKKIGEMQAEAYSIQYNWNRVSIVRPANVYGNYDNFNPENAMVIPSLIRKAQMGDVLEVWGDGSEIRDFVHSDDVALGMLLAAEKRIIKPLNIGSGKGYSIKEVVDVVTKHSGKISRVRWTPDKPAGDRIRLFDTSRIKSHGFNTTISLDDGIQQTTKWFLENRETIDKRYNVFTTH